MINVKIDNDTALKILMERVRFWRDDPTTLELFKKMYESCIDDGCFDNQELDIEEIVDNDVVNLCEIVRADDQDFKKLLELYKAGESDVSCEDFDCGASFIEAVSDDESAILIRC